ncbi:hypothetical protein Salat_2493900 [Sesamum alatum]|uniref:Uncharacterized protein n=1 Tax=Sesamum alatum TaxID=300844 RepID=A0AAE1XSA1_9LAMI|nr:hypothetical protein Salat_2493900 [Sesamum alatum]
MDKEQFHQLQLLGFYGILRESFTITFSKWKIFSQITILTIFPLCLLFLAHLQVSNLLFPNIIDHNEEALHRTHQDFSSDHATISSEIVVFWLIKTAYFFLFLVLSMLSTSAVVCIVACDYTRKETTFMDVMIIVVPHVWKRLVVTFAWSFIVVLAYNVVAFMTLLPPLTSSAISRPSTARVVLSGIVFVMYVVGFVYISIIWHLATVVSVLEQECGIEAMMKSKELVRGKMAVSGGVFLFLNSCFVLVQVGLERFVVVVGDQSFWGRIGCGIVGLLLLCGLTLLGLIVQTVVYFVCKSCHGEDVGNLCSGNDDPVEVYLGDYALLRSEDVRFEQLYV